MSKLDESLITSEVCVKCGHCCKWTSEMQHCHPDIGKEWLDVIAKQSDTTQLLWYDNDKVQHKSSSGNTDAQMRGQFRIRFTCPKLEVDKEAGTKMCTIYEDRPTVCRNYNCFRDANFKNQRPENWDYIAGIIKEVHGVDIEWDGPLKMQSIKLRDIT